MSEYGAGCMTISTILLAYDDNGKKSDEKKAKTFSLECDAHKSIKHLWNLTVDYCSSPHDNAC